MRAMVFDHYGEPDVMHLCAYLPSMCFCWKTLLSHIR